MKLATDKSFQHSHAKQLAGFLLPLTPSSTPFRFCGFALATTKGGTSEREKEMKMKIRPESVQRAAAKCLLSKLSPVVALIHPCPVRVSLRPRLRSISGCRSASGAVSGHTCELS